MPIRIQAPSEIAEKSTFGIAGTFKDEAGLPIPLAALNSVKLWWYALDSALTIVNSVNGVSILNADRGVVDIDGRLTLTMLPADAVILVPANLVESRIMLLEFKWAAGARQSYQEIEWKVRNLQKVP